MRNNKFLYIITLLFFALGFINIHFALLGFICMVFPFVLLIRNKKKSWCQGYCPRASLFTTCGKITSKYSNKAPLFIIRGKMKWIMLVYFGISLFIIVMSTIKVAMGTIPSMNYLRILLVIPIAHEIPQLIGISNIAPWITHLSYRLYSMMLTTSLIGLLLALIYKPRTWCTICPISTISNVYLKK